MRILQLVNSITTTGGIERYVERLSSRMLGRHHETLVAELHPVSANQPLEQSSFSVASAVGANAVLRLADGWRPDVVLSHQAGDARTLHLLHERGYPIVDIIHTTLCPGGKLLRRGERVCNHGMGTRCLLDWYLGPCGTTPSPRKALTVLQHAKARSRAVAECTTSVIVATGWMRNHARQEGIPEEKIFMCDIREGIPAERLARSIPARGTVRLIYVGRVVFGKGVRHAIQAMRLLPDRYLLDIVGDGWHRASMQTLAVKNGVNSRITFHGEQTAAGVNALCAASDVAVVPSIWPEPAGLVVPEARALGLPVVAFKRGGLSEWTSTYGLSSIKYAETPDAHGLAAAVLSLSNIPPTDQSKSSCDTQLHDVLEVLRHAANVRAR